MLSVWSVVVFIVGLLVDRVSNPFLFKFFLVVELFDELKPLDGLCFDLGVVTLHRLEVAAEGVELGIKKAFQELHVLSLIRILVK